MKTSKNILSSPIKYFRYPVFSFKLTQASAKPNSNILAVFNGNLGKAVKSQKRIPLDHVSGLYYF